MAYAQFAEIYDLAYSFIDYKAGAAYLREAVLVRCPQASSLLEVACGTGRYLEQFAGTFEVEGLDLSDEMLLRARQRLPVVSLYRGDMTGFDLGRQYDVVCCLFRSIAYVRTVDRLNEAIAAMARHVRHHGVVLVEPFFTPDSYWTNRVTLNHHRVDDCAVAWMYVSERTELGARLRIHCLVGRPTGIEHFVEDHELGLFTPTDFANAFRAAGLQLEYDPVGPGGIGLYIGRVE